MRRIELRTALPTGAESAWTTLVNTQDWPQWGKLVVSAEGTFKPGCVWTMQLRGKGGRLPRTMHPRFVSMIEGQQLAFETLIGAAWLVKMLHVFDIEPDGEGRSVLVQRFEISGALVAVLWPVLRGGMLQFDELGDDLARRLEQGLSRPPN